MRIAAFALSALVSGCLAGGSDPADLPVPALAERGDFAGSIQGELKYGDACALDGSLERDVEYHAYSFGVARDASFSLEVTQRAAEAVEKRVADARTVVVDQQQHPGA